MSLALRAPILLLSSARARSCAGHERRKCRVVSSSYLPHASHPGLSATLIDHRCRFSGEWPVRSRMRRDVCRRVRCFVSFRYAFECFDDRTRQIYEADCRLSEP
jgi:hypothetical protein